MQKTLVIEIVAPDKYVIKNGRLTSKPTPWPGMNEYVHALNQHWTSGNSFKRRYTDVAKNCALIAAASKRWKAPEHKCHVHFIWHEKDRRRDPDNIQSGAKFVLDGMVKAGVLIDDGQRYLDMPTHEIDINAKHTGVTVLLSVIEGKDD